MSAIRSSSSMMVLSSSLLRFDREATARLQSACNTDNDIFVVVVYGRVTIMTFVVFDSCGRFV